MNLECDNDPLESLPMSNGSTFYVGAEVVNNGGASRLNRNAKFELNANRG